MVLNRHFTRDYLVKTELCYVWKSKKLNKWIYNSYVCTYLLLTYRLLSNPITAWCYPFSISIVTLIKSYICKVSFNSSVLFKSCGRLKRFSYLQDPFRVRISCYCFFTLPWFHFLNLRLEIKIHLGPKSLFLIDSSIV